MTGADTPRSQPAAATTENAEPDGAQPDDAQPQDDKAKFKAALDRKRNQGGRGGSGPAGDSKIHGEHGAAGGKRTFRRKSGG